MASNGRATILSLNWEEVRVGFQEEVVFQLYPGEKVEVIQ